MAEPIGLILGLIVAGIVCVILYLIIAAVLEALGVNNPKWLQIARLIVLLLFLLWIIGILFGGVTPVPGWRH